MNDDILSALQSHQNWIADPTTGRRAKLRSRDLTGTDFTPYSLFRADLRRSNLTNCIMPKNCQYVSFPGCTGTNVDFSKSDISDTIFSRANLPGFNLIGATWNGVAITKVGPQFSQDDRPSFCTNAFVEIGCMQDTMANWEAIGATQQSLATALPDHNIAQLTKAWEWWTANKQTIRDWYSGL